MPKRIKKRRKIEVDEDAPGYGDNAGGWEEYFDYIFPEDESAKPNLKLLAMAKMWKKKKEDEAEETSAPPQEATEEPKEGENPDADDEQMRNESESSDSSSEEEEA